MEKLSEVIEKLEVIAANCGLQLNRLSDFKKAAKILKSNQLFY